MPEFLIRGRDPEGKRRSKLVEAGSAEQALRIVNAEGWHETRLMTDDVGGVVVEWDTGSLTPDEQHELGQGSFASFVAASLRRALSRSLGFWVFLAVLIVRRALGFEWNVWDNVLVAGLVILVVVVLLPLLYGSARKYDRLAKNMAWGRWNAVLDGLQQGADGLARHEQLRMRAYALAGLGRIDEALREYDVLSDGEEIPEWMYWSLRADIHTAAEDFDGAVSDMQKAYKLAPDNPTLLLTYAEVLMMHDGDRELARQLVAEVQEHPLAEPIQWAKAMVEGMFALDESRYDDARDHLKKSFSLAGPLLKDASFLSHQARINALLALAESGRGNKAAARKHFAAAEPMLSAQGANKFLTRCREELDV